MDHGRGHAGEPAHGPQADIEVEQLAQRHVEGAEAAADRRRERPLDSDQVVAESLDGLFGQPLPSGLEGLLASEHLLPGDVLARTWRRRRRARAGRPARCRPRSRHLRCRGRWARLGTWSTPSSVIVIFVAKAQAPPIAWARRSAASTALRNNMARVIGPTPPMRGVIQPATSAADSSTSDKRRFPSLETPGAHDRRARLDHVAGHEVRKTRCGHDDVTLADVVAEVRDAGVDDGDGRIQARALESQAAGREADRS